MDKDVDLVKHTNLVIDLGMVVEMTISVLLDFMAVVNAQVFLFEHLVWEVKVAQIIRVVEITTSMENVMAVRQTKVIVMVELNVERVIGLHRQASY